MTLANKIYMPIIALLDNVYHVKSICLDAHAFLSIKLNIQSWQIVTSSNSMKIFLLSLELQMVSWCTTYYTF